MHLVQKNNTLGAEVFLAAGASTVRRVNGTILTDRERLIDCSAYGQPGRNSDPHIGEKVNEVARLGADITLGNPVGLYFVGLVTGDNWEAPGGHNPQEYWRYTRGDPPYPVRAVYEVPPELGFTVGDIKIDGERIQWAAQIADFIKIRLTAVACRFNAANVKPVEGCVSKQVAAAPSDAEELPSRVKS
jgi:hypothetical protein